MKVKDLFKEFYIPTSEETSHIWASDETLFIFDTNVLLNFYSFEKTTQDDLLKVLNSIKNRVWIPFHVALEFQRRRLDVIKSEKKQFSSMNEELDLFSEKINTHLIDNLKKFKLTKKFPKIEKAITKEVSKMEAGLLTIKSEIQKANSAQMEVRSEDSIRDRIDSIFGTQVGAGYESQEELQAIYEEGATRYQKQIPPGYKDRSKDRDAIPSFNFRGLVYERKYGDLLIFKQIINQVKSSETKHVIFVTDDTKEDWWEIVQSNGDKLIGPRLELKSELYKEAQAENLIFYTSENFLKEAKTILNVEINENSLVDIKESVKDISDLRKVRQAEMQENILRSEMFFSDYSKKLEEYDEMFKGLNKSDFYEKIRERQMMLKKFDSSNYSKKELEETVTRLGFSDFFQKKQEYEEILKQLGNTEAAKLRHEHSYQVGFDDNYPRACYHSSKHEYEFCKDFLLICELNNALPSKQKLLVDDSLHNVRDFDWFKDLIARLPD